MAKTKAKPDKKRVNFRLPAGLVMWAQKYARSKEKNLTMLITDYLTELRSSVEDGNVGQF